MSRENGSIIGVSNAPTSSAAKGIWSLSAVALAVGAGSWPKTQVLVIQSFTATGEWVCPTGVTEVEWLIVAGGGGGGFNGGAGGGAGGFRTGT